MLKVKRKSVKEPETLSSNYIIDEYEYLDRHFNLPADERRKRRFNVNHSIIDSPDIKNSLHHLFHGKCAFCETYVSTDPLEVNVTHFRPTGNAVHNLHEKRDSPDHYGWLAYDWNNLLNACKICIDSKRNLFPVTGSRASVLSTWSEAVKIEDGTILDPCTDNPYSHFRVNHDGYLIPRTDRGGATIAILSLNRMDLILKRQRLLAESMAFISNLTSLEKSLENRKALNERLSPQAEFSGVLSLYLRSFFERVAKKNNLRKPTGKDLAGEIMEIMMAIPSFSTEFVDEDESYSYYELTPVRVISDELPYYRKFDRKIDTETAFKLIKRIEITNFKSIKNLVIDLSEENQHITPCLTLLGENSTGKSSVLQAITLCLMGKDLIDKLKLDPSHFIPRGNEGWKIQRLRPKVSIHLDRGPIVELEIDPWKLEFSGDLESPSVVLAYGSRRFFNENSKRSNRLSSVKSLFDPLATISNPLNWLTNTTKHQFDAVVRTMRFIFVLSDDDDIVKDEYGRVFVKANGRETPIESLSEGYKSLFAMAVDIIKVLVELFGNIEQARGVVIIDEIETHLHPRWKIKVMSALREAFPKVQFIVTTHDPLCLRGMQQGEIQVLFRDENNNVDNITDLPNAKNLRTEQLLTADFFGLNSTVDKELESPIDEYVGLLKSANNNRTEKESERLSELNDYFKDYLLIGDTPAQQILFQAIDQYLERSKKLKSVLDRDSVKQDAVSEIVALLESHRATSLTISKSDLTE